MHAVNQALATLAANGIGTNLVTFMRVVMRLDNADAANHVSNWGGTTYVFSIVGAIVADSYWGRYKACIIFQLILLVGLVELSISSNFFLHKYSCDSEEMQNCRSPTKPETVIFYMSIFKIALGNGAYQPTITTFGADQFDEEDKEEKKSKTSFYGYFFVANNLGSLVSVTLLTYIEDEGKWAAAFWISTGAAFLGLALFAIGTLRFRYFVPSGNPVSSVCQVVVAAAKNRHLNTPKQVEKLYEIDGSHSSNGGRKILHTPEYRCLDKAAIIQDRSILLPGEQPPSKPWSLCTVTQVEEVKCILRLVPIWLCSIIYSTAYSQMSSIFIEQVETMDNSLSKFIIPSAGVSIFEIVGVTSFVFIYTFCIAKPLSKRSKEPTELQRMGIGLVISTVAMITAGMVEKHRLKNVNRYRLSVLWQIPQYVLMGASEVFMYVTMTEFFNDQLPDGMRSLGSAMSGASMSAGSYMSSLLVTLVMAVSCKGDEAGWIPQDLNKGHVDRFFFLIAVLNAVDLVFFVVLAKRYRLVKPAAVEDLRPWRRIMETEREARQMPVQELVSPNSGRRLPASAVSHPSGLRWRRRRVLGAEHSRKPRLRRIHGLQKRMKALHSGPLIDPLSLLSGPDGPAASRALLCSTMASTSMASLCSFLSSSSSPRPPPDLATLLSTAPATPCRRWRWSCRASSPAGGTYDYSNPLHRPPDGLHFPLRLPGPNSSTTSRLRIFSGTANPTLAQEIACYLGLELGKIKIKRFADGELYVQLQESVRGCDVFLVQPTCPPANENLMELLIMIDACRRASAKTITAVIPYFGYARADRKMQGRESIAAKLVANLITQAGAHRVLACDLHSGQSIGYFDIPVDHVYGQPVILDYLASKTICPNDVVVVSPDVGGVARARAFAKKLSDAPLAIVDKRRLGHNQAEVMNLIGDVKGKVAVMVDDMIDTAGTMSKGAELLHREGARAVYACSTHAVLSPPAVERLSGGLFQEVIITNSVPVAPHQRFPQLTVLSVANLLGETIWRVHDECSVSSIFQ